MLPPPSTRALLHVTVHVMRAAQEEGATAHTPTHCSTGVCTRQCVGAAAHVTLLHTAAGSTRAPGTRCSKSAAPQQDPNMTFQGTHTHTPHVSTHTWECMWRQQGCESRRCFKATERAETNPQHRCPVAHSLEGCATELTDGPKISAGSRYTSSNNSHAGRSKPPGAAARPKLGQSPAHT